ncbi:MAG: DUF3383 family protein [Gammaproteobacteria bacterium AqS3]|nr:DUF3383 family protein [Gammaproteobacteria bacterium AqS3]
MATHVTGIDIEQVVSIRTSVEASLPRAEFGTGLMITQNAFLDGGGDGKVHRCIDSGDASAFFGNDADVSSNAAVWFAADPRPKALYVGRWARTAIGTTIESGPVTKAASAFSSGSIKFDNLNSGNPITLDFTSNSTYTAMATTMQTALDGVKSGTTVRYTNNRFVIDFPDTFTTDPGLSSVTGVGVVDFASAANLNLKTSTTSEGGRLRLGSAAESLAECVERCASISGDGAPVALMLADDVLTTDDGQSPAKSAITHVRDVAQTGDYLFVALDTKNTAKAATDTASEMQLAKDASATKTAIVYADDIAKRADIAVLAKLSGMDFNQPESIETLVPKGLPSVNTSAITETELTNILGKNGSVLTRVDGEPTFLGGKTAGGTWIDSQWWITWLKTEMERSIFNALRQSKRLNNAALADVVASVMSKAILSGGVQLGGKVSEGIKNDIRRATGNRDFNGTLSAGYVLWMDSPANQTTVDRAARVSRFKIWVAPSEAIQSVEGTIILTSG